MQTEEILQEYAKRKLIRLFTMIGFAVFEIGWLATTNGLFLSPWPMLGGAFLGALIPLFMLWRYWRCPACDRPLGQEAYKHCPECGTRLVA